MKVVCENAKTCGVLLKAVTKKKGEIIATCEHAQEHEKTSNCNSSVCLRAAPKRSACVEPPKEE
jgi:hypothetical protein